MEPQKVVIGSSLPPGIKPLSVQVSGHRYGTESKDKENDKTQLAGILELDNGTIAKELQSPPRGLRELTFYEEIFCSSCEDPKILQLRQYVPKFHGPRDFPQISCQKFICLENIAECFQKPCIADLKIGSIMYDPHDPPEKKKTALAKYPPAVKLGFTLCGFRVYDGMTDSFKEYDKHLCRQIPGDAMATDGLGKFFSTHGSLRKDVVHIVINKLSDILDWFLSQRQFVFYCCSVLIIYEGEIPHGEGSNTSPNHTSPSNTAYQCNDSILKSDDRKLVDVRMIDFAHVYHTDVPDDNYINGLKNIIEMLKSLLSM